MSDLREKLYKYLDDNDWGWRRSGVEQLISTCQQDFLARAIKVAVSHRTNARRTENIIADLEAEFKDE